MGRWGRNPYSQREQGWKDLSHGKQLAIIALIAFVGSLLTWLCVGKLSREDQVGTVVEARWEWHIDTERWDKVSYERKYTKGAGAYNVKRRWYDDDRVYDYDVDEWVHHRTFSRVGFDKHPKPPEYTLDRPRTGARVQKQCQMGDTRQVFVVVIDCEDGKGRSWETDESYWSLWKKGDNVIVTMNGFGRVQTLARLQVEK